MSSAARSRPWRSERRARLAQVGDLVGARGDQRRADRPAPGGSAARRARPARGPASRVTAPRSRSRAARDAAQLLGDVGHDQLGGVGGGRGPDVGDQVEQRGVGLVADRRDHRRADRVDRADQALVGERQQVLDRAAAAGDHDHVDARVAVEPLDGLDHLGAPRAVPCIAAYADLERAPPATGAGRCRARRAPRPSRAR